MSPREPSRPGEPTHEGEASSPREGASGTLPSARVRAFVAWAVRRGRLLWAVALLLAIPATARTAWLYLNLNSELEALLPREAPSVVALEELRSRMAGLQHLGVLVDVGAPENLPAGERFIDDLAAKIRAYPDGMVRSVRTGVAEERAFYERNAPLYLELADLRAIRERIDARREYEVGRSMGTLLDEDEPPPPLDFRDLEQKYEGAQEDADRFPADRFSSASDGLTMLLVEVGEFSTGRGRAAELMGRVRADIEALGGTGAYAPGMRVGFAGDVPISVEESAALMSDLSLSSVLVVVAVLALIVGYYRSWRSTIILFLPLFLATVYAFALASLPPFNVTELNTNTAFLGSIIVGNGVNFGIILLARHVEERRRGAPVDRSLAVAVSGVRDATFTAALAASVSYASLALTEFRGFRQFGYVGGLGMLLSWLTAFLLVPSLATWLDGRPPRPRAEKRLSPLSLVARLVARRPAVVLAVAAALTIGAALEVRTFGPDQIESAFQKLRSRDTWTSGEGYWGARMDGLLRRYLTPTVVLADDVEQARAIARALREAAREPPLDRMVTSVRSIDDVVPSDQAAKIAEAEAIRAALTPRVRAGLEPDARRRIERLLGQGPLVPITAADLPDTLLSGLRERDGAIGRTVLVYPKSSDELWAGPALASFAQRLREVTASATPVGGRPARVAGSLPLSADIYTSIRTDAVRASLAAFLGVVAVVAIFFRRSFASVLVIGSIVVGVLWLAAATMLLGVRLNFANFIAFPITFGIGADYALNVMSRHVQEGAHDPERALGATGAAVTLCSLTTIVGYSSLVLAKNRALHLFGLVAVLGEVACLASALFVLPAILIALDRRAKRRGK